MVTLLSSIWLNSTNCGVIESLVFLNSIIFVIWIASRSINIIQIGVAHAIIFCWIFSLNNFLISLEWGVIVFSEDNRCKLSDNNDASVSDASLKKKVQ
jgi:hypothetical protein